MHLYVFDLQYKEVEQSTKLIQTKKKIQQIKDKKKTNNVDSIMSPEALKDLPEISTQVPTYIFLDTCAVLNMIDYYTPRDNLHVAKTFTLKNLIEKGNLPKHVFWWYKQNKANLEKVSKMMEIKFIW